jgi:hypothetical protein
MMRVRLTAQSLGGATFIREALDDDPVRTASEQATEDIIISMAKNLDREIMGEGETIEGMGVKRFPLTRGRKRARCFYNPKGDRRS